MPSVRDVTFDLLRRLDLTIVVGNPGSTEETFLKNFPSDFTYVLALQESSVVGIADGLSQGLGKPVVVNVHTGAGMGNAMGCILTAYLNKTPLIITAGQQTRDMLLGEPFLTNIDETVLPKPWVKWSYEPKRPQDVPGAFMRAYAMAVQQPTGPVFLSLPLDDWDKEMDARDVFRTVSTRHAPDPARIEDFAARIRASANQAPVWLGPFTERVPFPGNHPLYAGVLPPAVGPLGQALAGHDLVIVVGAPVFRYYPWVAGETLPAGTKLLQIIDDPYEAAKSVIGDSLVADSLLALQALLPKVGTRPARGAAKKPARPGASVVAVSDDAPLPLTPAQIFAVLSELALAECIVVNESPSNMRELAATPLGVVTRPDSSYVMAWAGACRLRWGWPWPRGAPGATGQWWPLSATAPSSIRFSPSGRACSTRPMSYLWCCETRNTASSRPLPGWRKHRACRAWTYQGWISRRWGKATARWRQRRPARPRFARPLPRPWLFRAFRSSKLPLPKTSAISFPGKPFRLSA